MLLQEKYLRATQYLPDIVLLQEYLYEKYNTCISREEASQMTISELEKKTGIARNSILVYTF